MKYQGRQAVKVSIKVNILPEAYQNEELVKSGLVGLATRIGNKVDIIVPNAVSNNNDFAVIAFETAFGRKFNDMKSFFNVQLLNIEFMDQQTPMCVPIFELSDFSNDVVYEYSKTLPEPVSNNDSERETEEQQG